MPTGLRLAVLAGVSCIALAGCTDETGGSPQEPGGQPPSNSGNAVPKVANPLNADPFVRRPCDLIAPQAVRELGGEGPGEPDVDSELAKKLAGPSCSFDTPTGYFDVAIHTVHRDQAAENVKGIAGIYSDNARFADFQPLEIPGHPGYPAAIARDEVDVKYGDCPVFVGIADDLVFVASVTNDQDTTAACPAAMKVAAAVLDTLKKGA